MAKIEKMLCTRYRYPNEIVISHVAEIVVIDEGENFREINRYQIDLDEISSEDFEKILAEANQWESRSRKRLNIATKLSKEFNIPLEFDDC